MEDWKDTMAMLLAAFWVIVPILGIIIVSIAAGYGLFLLFFRVLF